jgi:hypothetical protein
MNMGFHYTLQYSRRTRVNVMGLVDHSTEKWERWYKNAHELSALQEMSDAGYKLIEIHFLYGFGLKNEAEEIELTRKMTENAHKVGIKVLGYFQFFSIQKELFFVENPWAKDCIAVKADGTPHFYRYDRPALCFTHKKVRQYYCDGIKMGLKNVDLDGIRLDNDYYRGCFCDNCQQQFRDWLKENFCEEKAKRVFGYSCFDEMELVPDDLSDFGGKDPAWNQMIYFRQWQRQQIMKELSDTVISAKPEAVLGGNPAILRRPNNDIWIHTYLPDLGETHHLICAENSLFPERVGDTIRHQAVAYKHGQSNNFKVFPSHHLHRDGSTRWPESKEEAARTLCEALTFGGHVPCTTWGIRMDEDEKKMLWQRQYFRAALSPVTEFLQKHGGIYKDTVSAAEIGIYLNRESMTADHHHAWYSLNGMIQIMMLNQIPFRFIDTDDNDKLSGLELLIIPDMRLISNLMLDNFSKFAEDKKILTTGETAMFDEYFLARTEKQISIFNNLQNVTHLTSTPECLQKEDIKYHGKNVVLMPAPAGEDAILETIKSLCSQKIKVAGSRFIGVDVFKNKNNDKFIHLLNYDNDIPANITVNISENAKQVEVIRPESLGGEASFETINSNTAVNIKNLHTYVVICVKQS